MAKNSKVEMAKVEANLLLAAYIYSYKIMLVE